jgi:hypothetical protein
MAATGFKAGAMGIDGSKHDDWSRRHMDADAVQAHFQQPREARGTRADADVDYHGPAGHSERRRIAHATRSSGGQRPDPWA